jgi:uncharacterized protein (TIGR02677 family)
MTDAFQLSPNSLRRVDAAGYLTAPNHERYRAIARFFHGEKLRHRSTLRPTDVFTAVKAVVGPDYTLADCEHDLAILTSWGNLRADQDQGKAASLPEFNRARFVYTVTPITSELEALLERLENDTTRGGALNATLIERLWEALRAVDAALRSADTITPSDLFLRERIGSQWATANSTFRDLSDNATEYLHTLSTLRLSEAVIDVEAFRLYKDTLLTHLKGFIEQLQTYGERVRRITQQWAQHGRVAQLADLLALHDDRHGVSHLSREAVPLTRAEVYARVHMPAVDALVAWFGHEGGTERLSNATQNAILAIVRQNERLATRHVGGTSRRRDLENLAFLLAACEAHRLPDDVPHRLVARTLLFTVPRHFRGAQETSRLLGERTSAWSQPANEYPLRIVRRGRIRRQRSATVADTSARQAVLRAEAERTQRRERALWDALFARGDVSLSHLEIPDPILRTRILEVIQRAWIDPDGQALASDGRIIQVTKPTLATPHGELIAPDGVLHLPETNLRVVTAPSR